MSLQVPSYPNPYSETPLTDAYAWFSFLAIDFRTGSSRVVLDINHDADAAAKLFRPVDRVELINGQELAPGVFWTTFQELMQDPAFAAAFETIRARLYAEVVARHPAFAEAIEVP